MQTSVPTTTTSSRAPSRGNCSADRPVRHPHWRYDERASRHTVHEGPVSVEPSLPSPEIENLMDESRVFPPDPAVTAQANATADLYAEAEADFEEFWAKRARERIDWSKPFERTLEWDLPFAKWFTGGELNVAYNCVDRHVDRGLGDKVAYHWIGEPGDTRTLTFRDLQ